MLLKIGSIACILLLVTGQNQAMYRPMPEFMKSVLEEALDRQLKERFGSPIAHPEPRKPSYYDKVEFTPTPEEIEKEKEREMILRQIVFQQLHRIRQL